MAGDLNMKHMDWNSRFITAGVSLLRDYANRLSCLIPAPDCSTTAPYAYNATPDVRNTVVVHDCPAFSSIARKTHWYGHT